MDRRKRNIAVSSGAAQRPKGARWLSVPRHVSDLEKINTLRREGRLPYPWRSRQIDAESEGEIVAMSSLRSTAVNAAAFSHASTPKHAVAHATKRTAWHTATKSAFYANFYAVVEATGAAIG